MILTRFGYSHAARKALVNYEIACLRPFPSCDARQFGRVKAAQRPEGVAMTRLNWLSIIETSFCVSSMITKSDPRRSFFCGELSPQSPK
jgi:hypothetical protein